MDDLFKEAHDLWVKTFNELPYETRKMLPDIYTRWQEVKSLMKEQAKVMQKLQDRELYLRKELIKWYKENKKNG